MNYRSLLTLLILMFFSVTVNSDDQRGCKNMDRHTANGDKIAEGGRLYDKWWAVYDLKKPTSNHPAYPKKGKKTGAATWRCKECHGWDYMGRDGAYASGSHATGIKGIRAYDAGSVDEVVKILRDDRHGYDEVMLDGALYLIAEFVVRGQVDMDQYIDRASRKARGNQHRGKMIFTDNCLKCHGEQGRDFNFKRDENKVEYIGTVANKNPWETLHKIRNGHPGAVMDRERMHLNRDIMQRHRAGEISMWDAMPSMRSVLTVQEQVDLLAYLQTLPKK